MTKLHFRVYLEHETLLPLSFEVGGWNASEHLPRSFSFPRCYAPNAQAQLVRRSLRRYLRNTLDWSPSPPNTVEYGEVSRCKFGKMPASEKRISQKEW